MSSDKILLRRVTVLILFLVQLIIIAFWKKGGEIASDAYSALTIDLIVMLSMLVTDSSDERRIRRIVLPVLLLIQLLIVGFWKRGGEMIFGISFVLVVVLSVMFSLLIIDVYRAWRITRNERISNS